MEKTDFVEVKEDFRQFSSFVSDYSVDTNNVEILRISVWIYRKCKRFRKGKSFVNY